MIKIYSLCIIYKIFPTLTIFGRKWKNGRKWKMVGFGKSVKRCQGQFLENFGSGERTMLYTYILFDKKSQIPHRQNFNKFPHPTTHPYHTILKEKRKKENEKDYCMEKRTH